MRETGGVEHFLRREVGGRGPWRRRPRLQQVPVGVQSIGYERTFLAGGEEDRKTKKVAELKIGRILGLTLGGRLPGKRRKN